MSANSVASWSEAIRMCTAAVGRHLGGDGRREARLLASFFASLLRRIRREEMRAMAAREASMVAIVASRNQIQGSPRQQPGKIEGEGRPNQAIEGDGRDSPILRKATRANDQLELTMASETKKSKRNERRNRSPVGRGEGG